MSLICSDVGHSFIELYLMDHDIRERRRELIIKEREIQRDLTSLPLTSVQIKGIWVIMMSMIIIFAFLLLSEYYQCRWFNMAGPWPNTCPYFSHGVRIPCVTFVIGVYLTLSG